MPDADPPEPPRPVRLAAAVVAAEGVALILLGLAEAVSTLVSDPASIGLALVTAAFAVGTGALLLWLARALIGLRRAARTPVVVLQLIALPVGWNLAGTSGRPELGLPVIALAVAVLVLLFGSEEARAALRRD
ncbi:MAG: hypothetical protein ACJ73E_15465 [Mycobacteriales bacterium]